VFRLWSGEPEEAAEVLLSVPEGPVPRPGRASLTSAMGLPSPAPPATPAQPPGAVAPPPRSIAVPAQFSSLAVGHNRAVANQRKKQGCPPRPSNRRSPCSGILVFRGPRSGDPGKNDVRLKPVVRGSQPRKLTNRPKAADFGTSTQRDWTFRINDRLFARTTRQKRPGSAAQHRQNRLFSRTARQRHEMVVIAPAYWKRGARVRKSGEFQAIAG
jgi:hypothetical protein